MRSLVWKGTRERLGRDWTKRKVFSEAMVSITSSGGVPKSSVMMENWCTSVPHDHQHTHATSEERRRTVLAGEEWLALEHLCEDAARGPDVDRDVVLLPRQHDLGRAVVPRRDVAGHLRILYSREAKVADLEVTVFVYENVTWFLRIY